ncbi:MAG: hypothetical protein LBP76_07035 [Treponema sp.]|jgi:hypothetical protein|nr:hypothetical protein [Treponema sp.]
MKMKKLLSIGAVLMMMAALVWAEDSWSFDDAIDDYASGLISIITPKNKSIAIVAFEANEELMKYFIDTMLVKIWDKGNRKLDIYERKELEKLQQELNFSLTDAVSDKTAQLIGHFVGVSTVIYGSMNQSGDIYRMTIKATAVETGKILFPKLYNLQMDDTLAGLLGISKPIPIPEFIYNYKPIPNNDEDYHPAFSLKDIGHFEVGGWFTFSNASSANNGDLRVDIEPYIFFSKSFSDSFGLNIQLGNYSGILTGDTAKNYTDSGFSPVRDHLYLSMKPWFNLQVGPGTLGLSLQFMPVFYLADNYDFFWEYCARDIPPTFIFNPAIWYRLYPRFGRLYFESGTDNMGIAKGADYDKDNKEYQYGLWIDDLYFTAGVDMNSGFSLWLTPYFFIGTNDNQIDSYFRKIRFEMSHRLTDKLRFGIRTDFPIGTEVNKTTMEYQGVSLSPYVSAVFGAIGITANFYVYHIGANTDYNEVTITPEIGISYTF